MILVTGANGFIGSVMVWDLNSRGREDLITVDSLGRDRHDLLKNRKFRRFLGKDEIWSFLEDEGKALSWIIHMGACSTTTETNWDFLQENNLEYSQRIFQWCAEHRKNLIYASSAATYGAGEKGFSDQTAPQDLVPLNLYGKSKLLMDQWALQQQKTPPHWYGLKFFNVYGPNEQFKGSMSSLVYKAYHQIRQTGRLRLFQSHHPDYRDGEQLRDFVYVKDVTRWMNELMEKKPQNGIYNMGFGQARTWLDLARAVFSAMDRPVQIDWIEVPANLREQYQYFTQADMKKWQSSGLSAPQWTLEAGVEDEVRSWLAKGEEPL